LSSTGFDLQLSHAATALPVAFGSLHAAALSARLHLAGLDDARRALHVSVGPQGDPADAGRELPLIEVTGLSSCDGRLNVTGVAAADRATVLAVSADGRVLWDAEVPTQARYRHWPRPVCTGGGAWLFSTAGDPGAMRLIQLTGNGLGLEHVVPLPDDSDGIAVLGDATGMVVARVHDAGQRLELGRLVGGRITLRVEVQTSRPTAPSLARVGDAVALAWIAAPGDVRLQYFDAQLKPLGAAAVLQPASPSPVVDVRLLAAADGALAVALLGDKVVADARAIHRADGTVEAHGPRRTAPLRIASCDRDGHLGNALLVDADAKLYAGDWVDGKLFLAHRGRDMRLSVFERAPRAP
jgi:hypothetical protein